MRNPVTSGNAEEVVRRVPSDQEILFVPDRHLGSYLEEVTGRKMILWNGACMVHEIFSVRDLLDLKRKLPKAITLAHPECPANIRENSDLVAGTGVNWLSVSAMTGAAPFDWPPAEVRTFRPALGSDVNPIVT